VTKESTNSEICSFLFSVAILNFLLIQTKKREEKRKSRVPRKTYYIENIGRSCWAVLMAVFVEWHKGRAAVKGDRDCLRL
jgi:hypothetical protein